MQNKFRSLLLPLSMAVLWLTFAAGGAKAATMSLSPQNGELTVGQTFNVQLLVNSENQGFNAAQATVIYPKDLLQVQYLNYSGGASAFTFWLSDPSFSNADGSISFVGGTTTGLVGPGISIIGINFKVIASGQADVIISDAAITASDGSGTNILSTIGSARFTIKPGNATVVASTSTVPAPSSSPAPVPVPVPVQIVRQPVKVSRLPALPEVQVPVFPDSAKWYNISANYLAKWNLPLDISDVRTMISQSELTVPSSKSEGLFDNKMFPALSDGIWYLHVRFKNNIGWGPISHYRLAVDTTPPLPFDISSPEGFTTDAPSSTLQFRTEDTLSGISHYSIKIDNKQEINLNTDSYALPTQRPGTHKIIVKAYDNAGNFRESAVDLVVLPIDKPVFTFINRDRYVGEGNLMIKGAGLPDVTILLTLKNIYGSVIEKTSIQSDPDGNWQAAFNAPLNKDDYYVEATARDARGALSLITRSDTINVRERPFLVVGVIEITLLAFFIVLFSLIAGGLLIFYILFRSWRKQVDRKIVIAQRDVINMTNEVNVNIDKMLARFNKGKITDAAISEIGFLLKKTKDSFKKVSKYVVDDIKQIDE